MTISDVSLGGGWWQASDGRWYPPASANGGDRTPGPPFNGRVDEVVAPVEVIANGGTVITPPGARVAANGWWLASDGNWYPPELHPSRVHQAPPPPRVPPAAAPSPGPGAWTHGATPVRTGPPQDVPATGPPNVGQPPEAAGVAPFWGPETIPTTPLPPAAAGVPMAPAPPPIPPATPVPPPVQPAWPTGPAPGAPVASWPTGPPPVGPQPDPALWPQLPGQPPGVPPPPAPPMAGGLLPPFQRDIPLPMRAPRSAVPSPVVPYPTSGPPPPYGTVAVPGVPTYGTYPDWGPSVAWPDEEFVGRGRRRFRGGPPTRGHFDARAPFVAGLSLLVLVCAVLPWYEVRIIGPAAATDFINKIFTYTLTSSTYVGWRLLVPIIAGLTTLVAIANMFFRSGERGAVTLFQVVRGLAIAQLAIVVIAMILRQPPHSFHLPVPNAVVVIELNWWAWVALFASLGAVAGAIASSGKVIGTTGR